MQVNRGGTGEIIVLRKVPEGIFAMVPSRALQDDAFSGVEFTDQKGIRWTVQFRKNGTPGGKISAVDADGKILIQKDFSEKLAME